MTYNVTLLQIEMHLRELDREAEMLSRPKRTPSYNGPRKQDDLNVARVLRVKVADMLLALRAAI